MRAGTTLANSTAPIPTVRDRILGEVQPGPRDEALVFAASSIINELTAPRYAGAMVERQIETEQGSYTLQGSRVLGVDGVHPVIFVYAVPRPQASQPAIDLEALRQRFRLTRKEARVAELLAAHKSNAQIATALFISSHTARHHTQSVLGKLGVSSRRDVADVLSRGDS